MRAALGLGCNQGDRRARLEQAVAGLADLGAVLAVSRFVETEPVGGPRQPPFLNAAVVIETGLSPRGLLESAHSLENEAGRERGEPWGPRTLDIDILLFDDLQISEPDLVVPHPRLAERAFVLEPLAEIASDWVVPGHNRSVKELLEDLSNRS